MKSRLIATSIASVVIGAVAPSLLKFMSSDQYGSTMLTMLIIVFMWVGLLLADLFPDEE